MNQIIRSCRFEWRWLPLACLVATALWPTTVWAQGERVINLESGLQLEGRIVDITELSEKVGDLQKDSVRQILMVDNGLTRTFVNRQRIVGGVGISTRQELEIDVWQRIFSGRVVTSSFVGASPFNLDGHRIFRVRTQKSGLRQYIQGITKLNPRYAVLNTLLGGADVSLHDWKMSVALGTVSSKAIVSVLEKGIRDQESLTEYLQIVVFLLEAGRYQDAADQLLRIRSLFPEHKQEIDEKRIVVKQEFAKQQLREIRLQLESGQSDLASLWIGAINRENLAGETNAELDDLLDGIENDKKRIENVKILIKELIEKFKTLPAGQLKADQLKSLERFGQEVDQNLSKANVDRLATFERLSGDPTQTDQQNIALAVSGWTLGSAKAIDNWAIAQSFLPVRDLVTEYLNSDNQRRRTEILNELAKFEGSDPSYLAPMLTQMVPQKNELADGYTGADPIEYFVTVPGTKSSPEPKRYRCLAHLPAQYDPYRKYPLMVTLPGSASLEQQLEFWCGQFNPRLNVRHGNASRNGFIVVSVEWRNPGQGVAEFSIREHAVVMRAYREALRRFAVDSDRVFLQGHGSGADLVYDIGIAHPEHWAGIVAVSATAIRKYPLVYAKNTGRELPIYAVIGSQDIDGMRGCKSAWNDWLQTGNRNDCTVVQYKGRLRERFLENAPEMFRWMRAQRRSYPDLTGFEFEAKSVRPTDNYFWFFEYHGLASQNTIWPEVFDIDPNVETKVTVRGKLSSNRRNLFTLTPKIGVNGATLWLSPEYFDFDQEVKINGGMRRRFEASVSPSREVMLEDVRKRADFQRPFWAKVDYLNGRWVVPE